MTDLIAKAESLAADPRTSWETMEIITALVERLRDANRLVPNALVRAQIRTCLNQSLGGRTAMAVEAYVARVEAAAFVRLPNDDEGARTPAAGAVFARMPNTTDVEF